MLTLRVLVLVVLAILLACPAGGCKRSQEETLAKVKREGVLCWGADPSGGAPFAFFDPKDKDVEKVIGFEVDLMDKLAGHLSLRHEMQRGQWENLLEALQARRCDLVLNGIEINPERQKRVDFSKPYYVYEQMLTVRVADKEKYKSLADLKGKVVGTLSGAQANNVLREAGWTDDLIKSYDDSSNPYQDLELGRVEAVVQEQMIAEYYAAPKPKLHNVPRTFAPGRYGVAVRKGDAALLGEIDRVLDLMRANGELAAIYKKWNIWNDRQKEMGIREAPATRPDLK